MKKKKLNIIDELIVRANIAMGKELTTKERKKLRKTVFCGPNRTFPCHDCAHIASAKTYLNRSKFSLATRKKIAACINRRSKMLGCPKGKPAKAKGELDVELSKLMESKVFESTKLLVEESIKNPEMDLFENAAKDCDYCYEEAKIAGSRSLPTDNKEKWDGSGAKKRMAKLAGGPDKEKINWKKYARGFVWVDPKQAETFGGYKFPFADVIGGKLKATWGGVSAAMGAVLGARGMPKDVNRKSAYSFLKGYYKKFKKEVPEYH